MLKRFVPFLLLLALLFPTCAEAKRPASSDAVWFTNTDPHFGDVITFGYVYTGRGAAEIHVVCYHPYGNWISAFVPLPGTGLRFGIGGITLAPAPDLIVHPWVAGESASCTATLTIDNKWGSPSWLASSPGIYVAG